jgi:hypothetical protein
MSFNKGRAARAALEARERQESQVSDQTVNERLLQVLERQAENQAQQIERTAPRENPNYKTNSPNMKPNGEQWSKDLKCEIFLGSFPQHDTPLVQEEVAALNRLMPAKGLKLTKNDRSVAKVDIVGKYDAIGRLERLTIQMPLRNEDGATIGYPSIEQIANELADQLETVTA